ncbi:MAG: type II toxin-antitoxin system RelE/ParE family toxin [Cyanobacteria bacterium P01_F01_bin.150]
MFEIRETEAFVAFIKKLKDRRAVARITARIDRLRVGNPGDVKPVGKGVSELRINYGPGYRVYYTQVGTKVIILLVAGDKSSQEKDIKVAQRLAKEY